MWLRISIRVIFRLFVCWLTFNWIRIVASWRDLYYYEKSCSLPCRVDEFSQFDNLLSHGKSSHLKKFETNDWHQRSFHPPCSCVSGQIPMVNNHRTEMLQSDPKRKNRQIYKINPSVCLSIHPRVLRSFFFLLEEWSEKTFGRKIDSYIPFANLLM